MKAWPLFAHIFGLEKFGQICRLRLSGVSTLSEGAAEAPKSFSSYRTSDSVRAGLRDNLDPLFQPNMLDVAEWAASYHSSILSTGKYDDHWAASLASGPSPPQFQCPLGPLTPPPYCPQSILQRLEVLNEEASSVAKFRLLQGGATDLDNRVSEAKLALRQSLPIIVSQSIDGERMLCERSGGLMDAIYPPEQVVEAFDSWSNCRQTMKFCDVKRMETHPFSSWSCEFPIPRIHDYPVLVSSLSDDRRAAMVAAPISETSQTITYPFFVSYQKAGSLTPIQKTPNGLLRHVTCQFGSVLMWLLTWEEEREHAQLLELIATANDVDLATGDAYQAFRYSAMADKKVATWRQLRLTAGETLIEPPGLIRVTYAEKTALLSGGFFYNRDVLRSTCLSIRMDEFLPRRILRPAPFSNMDDLLASLLLPMITPPNFRPLYDSKREKLVSGSVDLGRCPDDALRALLRHLVSHPPKGKKGVDVVNVFLRFQGEITPYGDGFMKTDYS